LNKNFVRGNLRKFGNKILKKIIFLKRKNGKNRGAKRRKLNKFFEQEILQKLNFEKKIGKKLRKKN